MEDKQLSTEQSLDLIARMLENSRRNFNDRGGAMFLIWGYTTIAVTVAVYLAVALSDNRNFMWLWCALPLIGTILTVRHMNKHRSAVQTHLDKSIWSVWAVLSGATVCCMVSTYTIALMGGKSSIDILFTIGLLMSVGTAITGRMIKFYPVEFGGFVGMGLSFAIMITHGTVWQMPLFAAVFLFGQIIPGHMLNAACRREAAGRDEAGKRRAR
ncbi:MAG: hypothetical protein LBR57_02310 [Alistipes sp.]|jgi:FtsH-binding integral membrane protein|nr:hypothetical protein [Alistipes sp.]